MGGLSIVASEFQIAWIFCTVATKMPPNARFKVFRIKELIKIVPGGVMSATLLKV